MKNKFLLFLSVVFLGIGQMAWGQISQNFNATGWGYSYGNYTLDEWSLTNVYRETSNIQEGAAACRFNSSGGRSIVSPTSSEGIGTITFYARRWSSSDGNVTFKVFVSDNTANWGTEIATETLTSNTYTLFTYTVNDSSKKFIKIEISSGERSIFDNINVTAATPSCEETNLTFANPTATADLVDGTFTQTATSLNETTAITYESSDEAVATVNPSTGEVSLLGLGTTTITANQEAGTHNSTEYCAGTATYELTVISTEPVLTVSTNSLSLTAFAGGASATEDITINGANLTGDIALSLTGDTNFSIDPNTLSASGGTVTVTYTPSASPATHSATLTVSNGSLSEVIALSGVTNEVPEDPIVCGLEDFTNATGLPTGSSYGGGTFTGNNDIVWSYHGQSAGNYEIDGNGFLLRRASDSYLEATIPNGVGEFSFEYRKAYTGSSSRQLELLINDSQVATSPGFGSGSGEDSTVYTFTHNVNVEGEVTVRIKLTGNAETNRHVTIDNITWTCYSGTQPTTPTLTSSVSELTDFVYGLGDGPSDAQSFALSGTNLDGSDDITILAGDGFEISLDDVDYFEEETLSAYDGTATDIYVRLKAELTVGNYSDIILIGGYGTVATVNISGEVTAPVSSLFRSKANGDWTNTETWESSANGTTWWQASTYPDESATDVVIRENHKVILNSADIKIANTEVYGQLEIRDLDFQLMGTGYALEIKNEAELILDGSGKPTSASTGTALIETGGNFKVVSFSGSNNLVSNYLQVGNSINKFKFEHHSIFEWANTNTLGSSGFDEIFDVVNSGDFVIFRMTQTFSGSNYGSSTNNSFNAILEILGDRQLRLQNSGHKTFRGGIQGTGVLTVVTTGSGKLIFGDTFGNPTLGNTGNLTLNVPHTVLQLQNIEVPSSAQVKIESSGIASPNTLSRIGGNLDISGELDITDMRIVNTEDGGVFVKNGGTLRTRHAGGLFGSGSAIVNDANFTMETGSTIDYYATEDQTISTGKEYYHLILSGGGTKTSSSLVNVHTAGSVTITGNPVVDFTGHNLASTSANTTSFTMDGGKLILGMGGTQPNMRGTYNLSGGVIEFANSSASGQTIRSTNAYSYQNIEVTGNSVGTSGGNLVLNENGTFVVKPNGIFTINANSIIGPEGNQTIEIEGNGTFRTGNADGFSGGDGTSNPGQTTSIRNNIENIILHPNSTVEYSRSGDQTITDGIVTTQNDAHYQNLRISGSGVKTTALGNLIVNEITYVDAATLRVAETNDDVAPNVLTARKGIQVVSGATALFENNANLMQDDGAVNSGDITVERFVQDMNNDMETQMDYVYWSSPVKEQSIQTFSPASQYKLWYNESNDYFYYIPSTEPNFIPAKGYAFSAENDKEDGYDETYQFIGTPQNDLITIPIKRSPDSVIDGITYKHGSNLVGNPYPSTIDAGLFHELNQDKIDFHFEFWTNESYAPEQEGSGYSNNNYAILTGAGFTPPSENQETYDFENKNTIKVGQGFIVKKTEIGGPVDLVFDNSIRLPESGHFYHRNNLNNEKDRFWLTFISPNQMLNTALIGYFPNATDDFDRNFDALSPVSSDAIFTLLGEEKLGIQGLEYPLEITDEIPLGVKSHTQGVGSIYLRRAEGIFENAQTIYLRDKYEDLIHNLSEGPYEFELEEGETLDRFEIIFQEDEVMSTSDLLDNPIKIYHTDQSIVIESEKEKILSVEVYDLNGRKVHSKDRINSSLYQIRKTSLATQVFVVKVLTDGGKVETRKIINQ